MCFSLIFVVLYFTLKTHSGQRDLSHCAGRRSNTALGYKTIYKNALETTACRAIFSYLTHSFSQVVSPELWVSKILHRTLDTAIVFFANT